MKRFLDMTAFLTGITFLTITAGLALGHDKEDKDHESTLV